MPTKFSQGSKALLTFAGLLLLLIVLVSLDSWIFRDAGPLSPAAKGSLSDDREQTARTYEAYKQWIFRERQDAFTWQARSTKMIFWLSVFVSLSGIGFSFWQFSASTKETEKISQENSLEVKSALISLAFKSRSIAALVLLMSMAYLVIYAVFIYPIKETNASISGFIHAGDKVATPPAPSGNYIDIPRNILEQAMNKPPEEK